MGGTAVADLTSVIGLLYRADWTRLSLSAVVHTERDQDLIRQRLAETRPPGMRDLKRVHFDPDRDPPVWDAEPGDEPGGYSAADATMLIAPGGRYREESPAGVIEGSDGQHGWLWFPPGMAPPDWIPVSAGLGPPAPELLSPVGLLIGFTLELRGPVSAGGRDALAVTATPRPRADPRWRASLFDRIELLVDAGLGILLRKEEVYQGQRLTLAELTSVTLDPPEAAGPGRFTAPPGSRFSREDNDDIRQVFAGPEWDTVKTVAGLAAGGLGALIRVGPQRPGHRQDGHDQDGHDQDGGLLAAMPSPEPGPHDPAAGTPASDNLLAVVQRSGEAPALRATLETWDDLDAMLARVPDGVRRAGYGGPGFLIDTVTRGKTVAHGVRRVLIGGPGRYRIDIEGPARGRPATVASDGERRWQVFQTMTMVGPVKPPPHDVAGMVDSSWLLDGRMSGVSSITFRGRRAYHLTMLPRDGELLPGPLMFRPADVVVDAESGCLLRAISYAGDRIASWWEITDIVLEPPGPGEFRPRIPPGTRIVEETGNLFTDAAVIMPGITGAAVRTTADTVRKAAGAVSAARRFLDDLRGGQPPRSG